MTKNAVDFITVGSDEGALEGECEEKTAGVTTTRHVALMESWIFNL